MTDTYRGFNSTPGVEIGAVANRSRESGQRVADAFNIPTVYDSWEELLEDESLDAVLPSEPGPTCTAR